MALNCLICVFIPLNLIFFLKILAENGCLEEFKNTAAFSRRYQAEQDCMCDTEHMFDCPSPMISQLSNGNMDSPLNDLEFNRFFQQALQVLNKYLFIF